MSKRQKYLFVGFVIGAAMAYWVTTNYTFDRFTGGILFFMFTVAGGFMGDYFGKDK